MRSLQKNMCDNAKGHVLYETMFVWNEYLTRGIRNHLQNTLWTVALVYGFFKQVIIEWSLDYNLSRSELIQIRLLGQFKFGKSIEVQFVRTDNNCMSI